MLVKTGVLNYSTLSEGRPYVIVVNLMLAGSPAWPDINIVNECLMFIPLQLLFEIAVWIAWYRKQSGLLKGRRRAVFVFSLMLLIAALVWAAYELGAIAGHANTNGR